MDARWYENWCAVVVDSLTDRVQLQGFKCYQPEVQAALDEWWDAQDVEADAEEIARSVGVAGEGFYLAETDADGKPRSFANRSYLCAVLYRGDNPREPELAAKWWEVRGSTYLTLYYPDRLEHYVAEKKRDQVLRVDDFKPDPETPEEPNPLGAIPVFHFRRDQDCRSRLTNIIPLNAALNKLFADMMVASEFGAYPQRWAITHAEMTDEAKGELGGDPTKVQHFPGADKESQDTEVGEFSATQLKNFIDGLDHLASRIAILSHTPKHYLLQQGDVSGEALIAMEAPLARDASQYMARLGVRWKHVAAFVMGLAGHAVTPNDIKCVWAEEHTVQPYTEALIHVSNSKAGMPLDTQLRREGWSDAELEQMHADMDAAEERGNTLAESLLKKAQADFDQGQNPAPYPTPQQVAE